MPKIHPIKEYSSFTVRCEGDVYTNTFNNGFVQSFKATLIDNDGNDTYAVRAQLFNPSTETLNKLEAIEIGEIFIVFGELKVNPDPTYSDNLIIKDINAVAEPVN